VLRPQPDDGDGEASVLRGEVSGTAGTGRCPASWVFMQQRPSSTQARTRLIDPGTGAMNALVTPQNTTRGCTEARRSGNRCVSALRPHTTDNANRGGADVQRLRPQIRQELRGEHNGRQLRRYKRRWKVERLFACLHNYRRLVVRYEWHAENYLGFLHLGCAMILLRSL